MSELSLGLTISSEEFSPSRLVEVAVLAEEAGFDFVSISDHYHPWVTAQGHSPFVWSVLGAISQATDEIEVAVGVTCPTIRIHPAILAQSVATMGVLLEGRFVWGVGTGEALNEHVVGDAWPPYEIRAEMLEEAISVIRLLWAEESVTHFGPYYSVVDARILDQPKEPVPIVVSAFGPESAELAASIGDGLWISGAAEETVDVFRQAGGKGPVYSQLSLCWAESEKEAVATAHRLWAFSELPGTLNQDLPTMLHYEQAVKLVTPEMVAKSTPCGPDAAPILKSAQKAVAAGIDHLYFHQIGPDQEGFVEFWKSELRDELLAMQLS
ncbi:MAG: TIGR03557 family F420-dependent LLM class oxidoreductase [Acidimicrobiia bacterium]